MILRVTRDRKNGAMRSAVILTSATAIAAVAAAVLSPSPGAAAPRSFTVKSTLAGTTTLPHRIHWLGIPSLPESKTREVDFLIDGQLKWVELHRPYSYGYNGNYLVTTWLRPGLHRFTVVAIAKDRTRATVSSSARVGTATPPPTKLAGTWDRIVTSAEAGTSGRAGRWTLAIDKVGWRILDPTRHGALIDVAYLSAATLEARGGIATRNHDSHEGNIWCDEPFQPVRYQWSVDGDTLTISLAGPKRCDGESQVLAGEWTRA
jgi:hypothetical protein